MTTLDDFFSKPTDSLHPRLRSWKARLDEARTSAALEVFRPTTYLGQAQPEMTILFTRGDSPSDQETLLWDDDLNSGLIQFQVRAVAPDQEAERFALGLRAALRRAEREFGDGYFNTVLVELLADSDLITHPQIAEVLKYIYTERLHPEGRASDRYTICRQLIADAISGRAHELTGPLKYPQEEAKRILVAALARYLDDRFSVSRRRQLGVLGPGNMN